MPRRSDELFQVSEPNNFFFGLSLHDHHDSALQLMLQKHPKMERDYLEKKQAQSDKELPANRIFYLDQLR